MHTREEIVPWFKQEMVKLYGDRLEKIILYGSRARGDYTEESDYDFLVVLKDEQIRLMKEIVRVSDITYPFWLETFIRIHFNPMEAKRFYNEKSPLLYWVRKEGIEV